MTTALLAAHVIAAIIIIGPITVAASAFPRYAKVAVAGGPNAAAASASASAMHRITRGYALPALAVPALGLATGAALGVLSQPWLIAAMVLTVAAGALLALSVVPAQRHTLAAIDVPAGDAYAVLRRLSMMTGLFGLTWTIVVVLMVFRPGSTTGT